MSSFAPIQPIGCGRAPLAVLSPALEQKAGTSLTCLGQWQRGMHRLEANLGPAPRATLWGLVLCAIGLSTTLCPDISSLWPTWSFSPQVKG